MTEGPFVTDRAVRAAELLLAARRDRRPLDGLPAELRPGDLDEAYAIQKAFVAGRGVRPVGYKIGCTSELAQKALGIAEPIVGRALEPEVLQSPASFSASSFLQHFLEPEFAFRLAQDLPPRDAAYEQPEVTEAVDLAYPAIEIVASGFGTAWAEAGAVQLVADNSAHALLVLGEGRDDWRGLDLAAQAVSLQIDEVLATEGVGANALGHPLQALTWLANDRALRAEGLKAGDIVTTGLVTGLTDLRAGQKAVADFGPLGRVEVGCAV